MKFVAEINIMPLKELLDPQGKAVISGLKNMGIAEITDVRIGKHISVEIEAKDEKTAKVKLEKACKELLSNPIMESYSYEINKQK
ncbi:MAG TPA: phosphoribosylformylglycinamidine synthase subunit PurS [Bacteroidales bacterium]|nr:phosphoribosylformylglycinamidine synthase subunit PurS [Bacteroidales bacterium]HQI69360.1 phosphoribosylformylglycinamidine synthase subunit PurS [Bacteroidales bacterium]